MQFDGEKEVGLYLYKQDTLLQKNIKGQKPDTEQRMETFLKAIIQDYMQRMTGNQLVIQ